MASYTLAQLAQISPSVFTKGVINTFIQWSPVMDMLPWTTTGTLDVQVIRTKSLPTIAGRKIGGTYTASVGNYEPIVERAAGFGGIINLDKVYTKIKNTPVDPMASQIDLANTAMALYFNNVFINGVPTSEAGYDSITGLWHRLITDLTAQQVQANASGLDVSPDASSLAANQLVLIDKVHEVLSLMPLGCDAMFMNRIMKLRLESALRASGMLSTTVDQYSRTWQTFGAGGPKIVDIGGTDPTSNTSYIIGNVETDAGTALTGGDTTSIYFVKFGENALGGWDLYPLDAQNLGLDPTNGLQYNYLVDWTCGIYIWNPLSVGRLYAVVAA